MRIALFTPYSPEIGGGSAQLRSHLAQIGPQCRMVLPLRRSGWRRSSALARQTTFPSAICRRSLSKKQFLARFHPVPLAKLLAG